MNFSFDKGVSLSVPLSLLVITYFQGNGAYGSLLVLSYWRRTRI